MIYADTSFLVSVLVTDLHSERAREMLAGTGERFAYNEWLALEIENALGLTVFRKHLTWDQVAQALAFRDGLLASGKWSEQGVALRQGLLRAKSLSRLHVEETGCRSLDVVQVALALETGVEVFWTFDKKQRTLAERAGLEVNR